ncbi:dihydroneopterin aldolase [Luminiphilus syltensis NOR5-1B]|uniref:7,8-dihydroneopterin aldolase n=1 Tax=Luminiphilus syltensis NOR5-1B TaxID=565045 RepID=B8KVX6_9GAMM|nr:dihydroneopterin aldolase [Luminiphilus syltensis]EED34825.1 dihydroneopterin aldolase [Luminiphilus syltensis NOR5-1B]
MDIVFIKGLRADAVIGVCDWERGIRQELVFDVELGADFARAEQTDALADAIDYGAVSERIKQIVVGSQFQLLEALAGVIATALVDEFGIPWFRLRVAKPGAVPEAQSVGVVIERGVRT